MVLAIPPAANGSFAVEEKVQEEKDERIKNCSRGDDETQAQSLEKHLASPADNDSDQACSASTSSFTEVKSEGYPSGIRLFIIIVALILSVFLVCVPGSYLLRPHQ